MDDRDALILDHIGRYTISIRNVIEDLFFDGASCGNALTRLADAGLVQRVPKALPGNYSYYQLTAKGAKSRGLPPNKATAKRETAIAQNLAALWFCCKSPFWRKRLNDGELDILFGAPEGGNLIYVAQNEQDEQTTVFRLFIPGDQTSVKRAYARTLRTAAFESLEDKHLRPWIERGTYRFAILLHNTFRKDELERGLQRENLPPLPVHVEIAPTPSSLVGFLLGEEEED
jgi:hypothetical protein